MNSETIAQKSESYGIPGIRVDGMDVFAVYLAVKEALDRARRGEGPTLIEAVTMRFGPHTTADDPTKYRDQEKIDEERDRLDPLLRVERLMKNLNMWDEEWVEKIEKEIETELNEAIDRMEAYEKPNPAHMFDYVFEEPTWTIAEQKEALLGRNG